MKIDPVLLDMCSDLFEYALSKLNAGDGWSCLSFVDAQDGRIANIYQDDSVEKAMRMAREEIASTFAGVTAYSTAFDGGWYTSGGDEVRAVIIDTESIEFPPTRLAYVIRQTAAGVFDRPTDDIIQLNDSQPPMLTK